MGHRRPPWGWGRRPAESHEIRLFLEPEAQPFSGFMNPYIINKYVVYDADGYNVVGLGDGLELPEITADAYTMEGAGLLGKFVAPAYGVLNPMEMELPFRVFYGDIGAFARVGQRVTITIKAAVQGIDTVTMEDAITGIKSDVIGMITRIRPGKIAQGRSMDSAFGISVQYYYLATSSDGEKYNKITEIDIFNGKHYANGVDMMKNIK